MEENRQDAVTGAQEFDAPNFSEKTPFPAENTLFSATTAEKILAFVMYLAAYLYTSITYDVPSLLAFCALFIAMTEYRFWRVKRSAESWVWLGCLVLIALCIAFGRNLVWGETAFLFLHLFAIYWVLCRSGRLAGGESGHLLPLDALHGVIIFPFKHFFLRIRTVWYTLTHLRRREKKTPAAVISAVLLALLAAGVLLVLALRQLSHADAAFASAAEAILSHLRFQFDSNTFFCVIISLPIGAYLFGLIAGTGREQPEALQARAEAVEDNLETLRKVPNALWTGIACVFALVYLAFFCLQASYLFGAFTRTIPDGYTVAEYARQGFFSLCRVMAVNFALLWLVTRSAAAPVRENKPALALCAVLLCQSMLFALIAASKLYLYLDTFGFTPKRLQSSWLVIVLFAFCVSALYSLLSGKKSFKAWLLFSGVTLSLLHLY